ncbi:MAG TPA: FCD domain-containing protein [Acidimicrobiales bacterium]|nr:FCD domain-containing protein [Acidimicrobiales bacterium]
MTQAAQRAPRPGAVAVESFRPVRAQRLADELVDQIRRLIAEEGLAEGARLPSERDLARRCGSSRAVVAQALRMLAVMGLVEIRPGSGAYVLRNPSTMVTASVHLMLDLRQGSLEHLCQLRLWLETLGAVEASAAASDGHLAELGVALERLSAGGESASSLVAADTNFHALVVAGAGNPYLSAIYESVHSAVVMTEYERWIRTDDAPDWLRSEHAEKHARLHRPIVEALVHRSERGVRRALVTHHLALLEHLRLVRAER